MSIQLTEDGVQVPEPYQSAEKVVIRTPTETIDMSSGFPMMVSDGIFPLVTREFYDDAEAFEDEELKNPELAPDRISFKQYGEEAEEFVVEVV